MRIDYDSAFVQLLQQNKAIPTPCQISKFENTNFGIADIQIQPISNNVLQTKNDTIASNSHYFVHTDWEKSFSYNNHIFKTIRIKNEVFYTSKDSIKTVSQTFEQNSKYEGNTSQTNNFLIILLIVIFSLLASVKVAYSKYYSQFLRSLFTYSESVKLYYDQNALIDRLYSILNLIFIFTGGIYLVLLFNELKISTPFNSIYGNFLISISIVTIFFVLRYLATKIAGWLFYQYSAFNEYLHSSFLYYKALGLFILPVVTIAGFIKIELRFTLLIIGCIIFLLTYFASIYRGTRIMLKKDVLLLYWILYLCTVEFFPLILLYKYIIS